MSEQANRYNPNNIPPVQPDELMYRSENFAGELFRDPIDVMTFETYELGNSDAALYMLQYYLEPDTDLFKEAERICLLTKLGHAFDLEEEEVREFFKGCLEIVEKRVGFQIKYGIWLATKYTVCDFYCGEMDEFYLDVYSTDDGVVLSDIDEDGMFIGFRNRVEPVETIFIERSAEENG